MKAGIINTIGKLLPILIFIVTIGGLLFSFIIGKIDWAIIGLYLAIPAIISCLVLYDFKGKNINLDELQNLFSSNQKSSIFIFYILFFILITSILLFSDIIIIFILGIIILYIIILLQILSKPNISPSFLILEMISLIALFFYKTVISVPFYVGTRDILMHNKYDLVIYLTHHILPSLSYSDYVNFPLYHIFCVEGMNILNLNSEIIYKILTWPITALLIIPIIYLFFREIINNRYILLFSIFSLSIIISGKALFLLLPRGLAFFGVFLMLYILFKLKAQSELSKRIAFTICLLPVMFFILLVHHVSLLLSIILIILLIICEFIVNYKIYFANLYFLFFVCMSLTYWFYFATQYIEMTIIPRYLFSESIGLMINVPLNPNTSLSYYFINDIEIIITIFLLVLSIGYLLRSKKINYLTVLSLFSLFVFLLYIKNPLWAVYQFRFLFGADYFNLLLSPFICLMIGVGLSIFYQYLIKKFNNKRISFVIFFGIIIIFMVGTMGFVYDDMGYPEKVQFDLGEIRSFNFFTNNVPFNETIYYPDIYTDIYLSQNYFKGIENLGIPYYSSHIIYDIQLLSGYPGYTIIPIKQFNTIGMFMMDKNLNREYRYSPTKENIIELNMVLQKKNKIYSNKVSDIYYGGSVSILL